MRERYEPPSEFLRTIIAEEVPLSSGELATRNLDILISMTDDEDDTNRDWAVFLLAQLEEDTTPIRNALLRATKDRHDIVRAEAILGLARRDKDLALPLVQEALRGDRITTPALEAAEICADPSLIPDLRVWAEPSIEPFLDELAGRALAASQARSRDQQMPPA